MVFVSLRLIDIWGRLRSVWIAIRPCENRHLGNKTINNVEKCASNTRAEKLLHQLTALTLRPLWRSLNLCKKTRCSIAENSDGKHLSSRRGSWVKKECPCIRKIRTPELFRVRRTVFEMIHGKGEKINYFRTPVSVSCTLKCARHN